MQIKSKLKSTNINQNSKRSKKIMAWASYNYIGQSKLVRLKNKVTVTNRTIINTLILLLVEIKNIIEEHKCN